MEAHDVRLIKEFEDLYIRYYKLCRLLSLYENGQLSFKLKTPLELLLEQKDVMKRYLCILFERFKYEEIIDEVYWDFLNKKRMEILNE